MGYSHQSPPPAHKELACCRRASPPSPPTRRCIPHAFDCAPCRRAHPNHTGRGTQRHATRPVRTRALASAERDAESAEAHPGLAAAPGPVGGDAGSRAFRRGISNVAASLPSPARRCFPDRKPLLQAEHGLGLITPTRPLSPPLRGGVSRTESRSCKPSMDWGSSHPHGLSALACEAVFPGLPPLLGFITPTRPYCSPRETVFLPSTPLRCEPAEARRRCVPDWLCLPKESGFASRSNPRRSNGGHPLSLLPKNKNTNRP